MKKVLFIAILALVLIVTAVACTSGDDPADTTAATGAITEAEGTEAEVSATTADTIATDDTGVTVETGATDETGVPVDTGASDETQVDETPTEAVTEAQTEPAPTIYSVVWMVDNTIAATGVTTNPDEEAGKPADPTKDYDGTYAYVFKQWNKTVEGTDITYTAEFTATEVPAYKNVVVDMSQVPGTETRSGNWTEADNVNVDLSSKVYQIDIASDTGAWVDLGNMDLSKYSGVRIIYGGTGIGPYVENEAMFYLTKDNTTSVGAYNEAPTSTDHVVATEKIATFVGSGGWFGVRTPVTIDLTDVDYSGQLYLTAPTRPSGAKLRIFYIEFIGGPNFSGEEETPDTP